METLLTLTLPWLDVLALVEQALTGSGFHVDRSFDFKSARASLLDPSLCPCPDHGSADCNCQYIVLLVGVEGKSPVSLEVHGNDDQTYISLVQTREGAIDGMMLDQIRQITNRVVATGHLP
jgi:hypothetical protein